MERCLFDMTLIFSASNTLNIYSHGNMQSQNTHVHVSFNIVPHIHIACPFETENYIIIFALAILDQTTKSKQPYF